jgi:uncharacterized protein (TIGR03437 family)
MADRLAYRLLSFSGMRHYASNSIAMTHRSLVRVVPFRHTLWRALPLLWLLAALANVLCATNAPRFAFTFSAEDLTGTAVAVDSAGNTYLTGSVWGNPFTATLGAYQSQNAGGTCYGGGPQVGPPQAIPCRNAFVIKLDPSGAVVFATYLGGSASATTSAIAVDSQGDVYVAGSVISSSPRLDNTSFPITPGAAFTSAKIAAGAGAGFLVKLNASGTQLAYSTLIPGASVGIFSIAVDSAGSTYFTGEWSPVNGVFPATPGAYQSAPPNATVATIVGKLNASGSALVYGTYLSGTLGPSYGVGIAVDAAGNVLVGGDNSAADFPITVSQSGASLTGLYLAKLNSDGSKLTYATVLGPAVPDTMKVAPSGDIYFVCSAASDFPVTSGGFGVALPASGPFFFLLHVSADGSSALHSIYLPFSLYTAVGALDVDSVGNAYVVGPGSLPTTTGAFQPSPLDNNADQVVIAKITPGGEIAGATYLGASGGSPSIAAERDGSVVVVGGMYSIDLPGAVTPPQALGTGGFLAANFFPAITVENSASFVANMVVPGELVSIQGYGIGPAAGLSSSPAPTLGGVQVYFGDLPAPIIYAQADQINAQAPWEITGQQTTQVRIVYDSAAAGAVTVPVGAALPGVFYVVNSDGSFNSPSNPARAGDYVSVFGTGAGATSPPGVTGRSWPLAPLSSLTQHVSVAVGGETADVLYSGSAPTLESGFFQINAQLPADLSQGAQFLRVTIGGDTSAPAAISIQ